VRVCFVEPDSVIDGKIIISDVASVRHIVNVLRKKQGDYVEVSDGAGKKYICRIDELPPRAGEGPPPDMTESGAVGKSSAHRTEHGRGIVLAIEDIVYAPEPCTKITLFQCVSKQGKMEVAIQKSTELGAAAFVPVFSDRSVPKAAGAEAKLRRWRRVAEEAAKQSGRSAVPSVADPVSMKEAAGEMEGFDLLLFPYENEGDVTIKDVLRGFIGRRGSGEGFSPDSAVRGNSETAPERETRIAVIIGPEGGFTDEEARLLCGAGAEACSLGANILRAETAGPAAIAMILYELEL
jgi:16S rRNA (uracil1498-N3)-methyltransferase